MLPQAHSRVCPTTAPAYPQLQARAASNPGRHLDITCHHRNPSHTGAPTCSTTLAYMDPLTWFQQGSTGWTPGATDHPRALCFVVLASIHGWQCFSKVPLTYTKQALVFCPLSSSASSAATRGSQDFMALTPREQRPRNVPCMGISPTSLRLRACKG